MPILTADWHLTDAPEDEYRWQVFDHLARLVKDYNDTEVWVLGDLTDRKDKHGRLLVNRMVQELAQLPAYVEILMGNHDMPLDGTPFWSFLNKMKNVEYHPKPRAIRNDALMLPYSANPKADWEGIDFKRYKCVLTHQTFAGATENGQEFGTDKFDEISFPRGVQYYAGDIHTTQRVKLGNAGASLLYVGAPHVIKYGDSYPPQMVVIDDQYKVVKQVPIRGIRKWMIRLDDLANLDAIKVYKGDMAKVIYSLPIDQMDRWGAMQDQVTGWARQHGVILASIEPSIQATSVLGERPDFETMTWVPGGPTETLRDFAAAEEIDGATLDLGLAMIEEARGATD